MAHCAIEMTATGKPLRAPAPDCATAFHGRFQCIETRRAGTLVHTAFRPCARHRWMGCTSFADPPDACTENPMRTTDLSHGQAVHPDSREAMLVRARREAWPDSVAVGLQLGGTTPAGASRLVAVERAAGRVLGVWSSTDQTFYHPRFQFLPCGAIHPRISALLAALAGNPALNQAGDPGGWQRLEWLVQPRTVLSVRHLSRGQPRPHEASTGPDSGIARAAIDVFPTDPVAVVAFAREDVARMRMCGSWRG